MESDNLKDIISAHLQPYWEMLDARRVEMPSEEWLTLTRSISTKIGDSPDQYLGKTLAHPDVLRVVVSEVFDDFLSKYQVIPHPEIIEPM